ncbi:MAG: hypothetical protein ACR2RL_25045 [Gammaproteobacteria bacterium]
MKPESEISRRSCLARMTAAYAGTIAATVVGGWTLAAVARDSATPLKFRECWARGMAFTDKVKQLDGKQVIMRGFMAPPLKPDADFFVLTARPMSVCPFCETEAEWPDDIILVRLKKAQDFLPYNVPVQTSGELQIGTDVDEETGFVSRLRIVGARFERASQ